MNTKTLMLALVTALSLGAGSAMAQEGAPSMPTADYWSVKAIPANSVPPAATHQILSGSSDENAPLVDVPMHIDVDYSDLANPG